MNTTLKTILTSKKFIYTLLAVVTATATMAIMKLLGFNESSCLTAGGIDALVWSVLIYSQGLADTGKSAAQIDAIIETLGKSIADGALDIDSLKEKLGMK